MAELLLFLLDLVDSEFKSAGTVFLFSWEEDLSLGLFHNILFYEAVLVWQVVMCANT